jgi:hypothetical protein
VAYSLRCAAPLLCYASSTALVLVVFGRLWPFFGLAVLCSSMTRGTNVTKPDFFALLGLQRTLKTHTSFSLPLNPNNCHFLRPPSAISPCAEPTLQPGKQDDTLTHITMSAVASHGCSHFHKCRCIRPPFISDGQKKFLRASKTPTTALLCNRNRRNSVGRSLGIRHRNTRRCQGYVGIKLERGGSRGGYALCSDDDF